HLSLEEVAKIMAEHGYEMMEIPAYSGCEQFSCDEVIQDAIKAPSLRKMLKGYGIGISALSNHADSLLILGPHTEDTDKLFPGTKAEKIKYGTENLLKSAQAANALEVPVVNGFTGVTNWGRYFPFPSADGWEKMEH